MAEASQVKILVVDDEPAARSALTELLREEGFEVQSAGDGYKALGRLDGWAPDVLVTDLKMPGMDGVQLMQKVRDQLEDVSVIVMTAFGSVESAVAAMQKGADDYLTKPLHMDHLLVVLNRVLQHRRLREEADRMRRQLEGAAGEAGTGAGRGPVGRSKPFRDLMALVEQVADSDASVLVTGESGTGKVEIARALHDWSPRKEGPFVTCSCSAFAEDALARELFGYDKDAFPGATTARDGKLAAAEGGTLFLADVDHLTPALQVALLRVLQEKKYEPAGSKQARAADVRIVASTDRDLHEAVGEGRFREDLYYRLNVINLRVPTLRERRDDLPLLANHFLREYARRNDKTILGFTERALGVLLNFDWPGNIRQLENCIERAVVMCTGQEIEPRHLPREIMSTSRKGDEMPHVPGATLRELERFAILRTLEHVGGSTSKAAKILGISPRKIQYRLNEYREEDSNPSKR